MWPQEQWFQRCGRLFSNRAAVIPLTSMSTPSHHDFAIHTSHLKVQAKSCGHGNKLPYIWRLKNNKNVFSHGLGGQKSEIRCQQSHTPSKGSRGESFLDCPRGLQHSFVAAYLQSLTPPPWSLPFPVCVFSSVCYQDPCHWIQSLLRVSSMASSQAPYI